MSVPHTYSNMDCGHLLNMNGPLHPLWVNGECSSKVATDWRNTLGPEFHPSLSSPHLTLHTGSGFHHSISYLNLPAQAFSSSTMGLRNSLARTSRRLSQDSRRSVPLAHLSPELVSEILIALLHDLSSLRNAVLSSDIFYFPFRDCQHTMAAKILKQTIPSRFHRDAMVCQLALHGHYARGLAANPDQKGQNDLSESDTNEFVKRTIDICFGRIRADRKTQGLPNPTARAAAMASETYNKISDITNGTATSPGGLWSDVTTRHEHLAFDLPQSLIGGEVCLKRQDLIVRAVYLWQTIVAMSSHILFTCSDSNSAKREATSRFSRLWRFGGRRAARHKFNNFGEKDYVDGDGAFLMTYFFESMGKIFAPWEVAQAITIHELFLHEACCRSKSRLQC